MLRLTAIDIVQLDDEKTSDFCLCKSIIDKVSFLFLQLMQRIRLNILSSDIRYT